jgi:nitrogen-specific signal transduction histidine kinase
MSMINPMQNAASQTGDAKHDRPAVMDHVLAAINMLNLGILVVDREARITFANHSAKTLLQSNGGLSVHTQPSANTITSASALSGRQTPGRSGRPLP